MLKFLSKHKEGLLVGGGAFAVLYGGTVLWKDKLIGKRYDLQKALPPEDPEEASRQKVYLITGANSGIGKALAADLAKLKNNKVYMLCRDMESCEKARSHIVLSSGNKYVYCRPCDLASFKSIRKCAEIIKEKEPHIDGLVNNAGIMFAPRAFSEDGIESHWAINHLGHILLTRLLTDSLENGGRVLFLVNLEYRKAREGIKFDDINMEKAYDKNYAFYQSQLANVLATQALSEELSSKMISVNAVYPGIVRGTKIKRHMGVDKSKITHYFARPAMWLAELNPSEGAHTVLFMLVDRSVAGLSGKMYASMAEMAYVDIAKDMTAAKKLLAIDDYWAGIKTKEEILKTSKK